MFDWKGSGLKGLFLSVPSYPVPGRGPSGVAAAKRAAAKRRNRARAKR